MAPTHQLGLERALALAREQHATTEVQIALLEAALAGVEVESWVALKEAAARMRITEEAARKRASRGAGEKIGGRWYFRTDIVQKLSRR